MGLYLFCSTACAGTPLVLQGRMGPTLPAVGTPLIKLHNISLDVTVAHLAAAKETLLAVANVKATTHRAHVRHAPIRQNYDHGSLCPGCG